MRAIRSSSPGANARQPGCVALADRERHQAVGVLVEDQLAGRRVGERAGETARSTGRAGAAPRRGRRPRARAHRRASRRTFVATLPNRSTISTVARTCVRPTSGSGSVDAHERRRVDCRPELRDRHAGREMRGRRREDVARVEGARDLGQAVARVGQLVRGVDAELVGGEHEQAVVGPDEQAPVDASRRATARRLPPTSGIDDGEVHAGRQCTGSRCAARARPGARPAGRCRA